jgi:hypothetical protein
MASFESRDDTFLTCANIYLGRWPRSIRSFLSQKSRLTDPEKCLTDQADVKRLPMGC